MSDWDHEGMPMNAVFSVILARSNVVADAQSTDDLRPTVAQYELGPGKKAIMAGSQSDLDNDLTILEILDPDTLSSRFPDWEERLMRSFVLCKWRSMEDDEGGIGWFSRVKLIAVSDEQYSIVEGWISNKGTYPKDMPSWLMELYAAYTEGLAELSPGKVPKLARCGVCNSTDVRIVVKYEMLFNAPAGELVNDDGETKFAPMSSPDHECETTAYLHCTSEGCHATRELEAGELLVSASSPIGKIIGGLHGH